jgi:hypothetical protein
MSSNSDINQRAKNQGGHPLSSTQLSLFNGYSKHPHGNFRVPSSYVVDNKHKVTARQAPQNAITGSSFFNASETIFKVEPNLVSTLTHAYIQIKITNSTGAGVTLAPVQSCIERIEILGTSGNVLAAITGQQMMLSNMFMFRNEFEQLYTYLGFASTAYSTAGDVIANGASAIRYIPLLHVFAAAKLHLAGLRSQCSIKVITQGSTYCLISGSHPTVTDVQLILKGYGEPVETRTARYSIYNDSKLHLRKPYLGWLLNKEAQTLAVSTQYSSTLNNIKGTVAGLVFVLRSTTITAANQNTYQPVTSFDLQLASGESLLGHYVRLHEDSKVEAAELFGNLFIANKDAYVISFSEDLAGDYITGHNHGYNVFTGTEKLIFTTNSTITPGSYWCECHALTHEHLLISKGLISNAK